jgi:hypothetical protein
MQIAELWAKLIGPFYVMSPSLMNRENDRRHKISEAARYSEYATRAALMLGGTVCCCAQGVDNFVQTARQTTLADFIDWTAAGVSSAVPLPHTLFMYDTPIGVR